MNLSAVRSSLLLLVIFATFTPGGSARQSAQRPPPSLKAPTVNDVPPSNVQKRFDRAKKMTYVTIDLALSEQSRLRSLPKAPPAAAGEVDVSFELAYKGAAATDLSAARLTLNFVVPAGQSLKLTANDALELQADAYEYRYQEVDYQLEQVPDVAALERERVSVALPVEDVQQIAFASQVKIKVGKKDLALKSIQLTPLRQTVFSNNSGQ